MSTPSEIVREDLLGWPELPRLSRLASRLFGHLQNTGLLAFQHSRSLKESMEREGSAIRNRLIAFRQLAGALESISGPPRFAPDLAYLHNLMQWRDYGNLGGYIAPGSGVSLDDLMVTYGSCWILGHEHPSTLADRLLRGALTVLQQRGEPVEPTRYLLDLALGGMIPSDQALYEALGRLWGLAIFHDDLRQFGRDSPLPPLRALAAAEDEERLLKPWETFERKAREGLSGQPPNRQSLGKVFDFLTQSLTSEARRTERAANCDAFVLGQARLYVPAVAFRAFGNLFEEHLSVGAHSILDFAEEVRADAGGSAMSARRHPWQGDAWDLGYFRTFWKMFHRTFGESWIERIRRARVLLPQALEPYAKRFIAEGEGDRPLAWSRFSRELAPALCATFDMDPNVVRRGWRHLEGDEAFGRLAAHLREILGTASGSGPVDELMALLRSGRFPGDDRYSSQSFDLTDQAHRDAATEAHRVLARGEVSAMLIPLIERWDDTPASGKGDLLAEMADLNEVFPWSTPTLLERGIAHDRLDEPETALGLLEDAVQLSPDSPHLWHSLGVVYGRLDTAIEGRICQLIGKFFEEEK